MTSFYPYSSGEFSLVPMPPLEPLPLDDLTPLPLDPLSPLETAPPPRSSGTYRRRCTAALAMLMAGCNGRGLGVKNEDELRCRYPSKLCCNTRVRKSSGGFHRYCAYHRDKANANQQRWVGRQRGGAGISPTSSSSPCSSTSSSAVSSPASSPSSAKRRWIASETTFVEPCASAATLNDDDWDALLSLLEAPATPIKTEPASTLRARRQRPASTSGRRRRSPLY